MRDHPACIAAHPQSLRAFRFALLQCHDATPNGRTYKPLNAGRTLRLIGIRPSRKHSDAGRLTDAYGKLSPPLLYGTAGVGRFSTRFPPIRASDSPSNFAKSWLAKSSTFRSSIRDGTTRG